MKTGSHGRTKRVSTNFVIDYTVIQSETYTLLSTKKYTMRVQTETSHLQFNPHTSNSLTAITATAGPTKLQIVPPTGDNQQLTRNKTKRYTQTKKIT